MAAPRRRFVIGGNFKAAATSAMVRSQVAALNAAGELPAGTDVVIAPSALHVEGVKASVRADVAVAVQDVHTAKGLGAFTGSHTVEQVKDAGVSWILTGHSERRSLWGETDEQTAAKSKLGLDAGMTVIACIGETLPEREAGATLDVVFRQVKAIADAVGRDGWARMVLAYEPVWAIGTGKVATPEQAQEVHAALRGWLSDHVSPAIAAATPIIYGGSVNAANSASLITQPDIDGFLVGGASLKPEFLDIIRSVTKKGA